MDKKICFVITPIGSETDAIRRHIDGVIDAAISPALGEGFELRVSHRIYEPGSITKQIIHEIYKADLVIANLTDRNPNVMYELAIRHCIGRPVITIADCETKLPADIILERAIPYHNDAKGVLELRETLSKYLQKIDYSKKESLVLDALKEAFHFEQLLKTPEEPTKAGENLLLKEILNKLYILESKLSTTSDRYMETESFTIQIDFENSVESRRQVNRPDFFQQLYKRLNTINNGLMFTHSLNIENSRISLVLRYSGTIACNYLELHNTLMDYFVSHGINPMGIRKV